MASTAYLSETTALRFVAERGSVLLAQFRDRRFPLSESGGLPAALRCLGHGWLAQNERGKLELTEKGRKELKLRTS